MAFLRIAQWYIRRVTAHTAHQTRPTMVVNLLKLEPFDPDCPSARQDDAFQFRTFGSARVDGASTIYRIVEPIAVDARGVAVFAPGTNRERVAVGGKGHGNAKLFACTGIRRLEVPDRLRDLRTGDIRRRVLATAGVAGVDDMAGVYPLLQVDVVRDVGRRSVATYLDLARCAVGVFARPLMGGTAYGIPGELELFHAEMQRYRKCLIAVVAFVAAPTATCGQCERNKEHRQGTLQESGNHHNVAEIDNCHVSARTLCRGPWHRYAVIPFS